MSFIPGSQLACAGAVEYLVAATTRSQLHEHRATAVIAELEDWFPKTGFTELRQSWNKIVEHLFPYCLSTLGVKLEIKEQCVSVLHECVCLCTYVFLLLVVEARLKKWRLPLYLLHKHTHTHTHTHTQLFQAVLTHKMTVKCFCLQKLKHIVLTVKCEVFCLWPFQLPLASSLSQQISHHAQQLASWFKCFPLPHV